MNTAMSVREAAAFLGISKNFTYELIRRGEIPVLRLGTKRIVVSRATLEQMLEGKLSVSA